MQSLKKIHAWAQMQDPLFQLFHGAALAYVFCNLMVADNTFKMEHEYSYDLIKHLVHPVAVRCTYH